MTLNGVIDAAVMGGTAKYQEAFFSDGYILSNPEHEVLVNELYRVILLQVRHVDSYSLTLSYGYPLNAAIPLL